MTTYIVINEWCNATESGYDIADVFNNLSDAKNAINTMHLDFVRDCDKGEIADFEEYDVDHCGNAVSVRSRKDSNLYEMYYFIIKTIC